MPEQSEAPLVSHQVTEPSKIKLHRHEHDRLSSLSRLLKTVQSRLGIANLHPKEGQHSGKTYYKVDRDSTQTQEEASPS